MSNNYFEFNKDYVIGGKYDPLGLHYTDKLLTLTPTGLSFTISKKRKYESYDTNNIDKNNIDKNKDDIIKQLNYNSLIAIKYYNRSDCYVKYYKLYDKLIAIKELNNDSFIQFEKSIYELKILYISLNENERSIIKYDYDKIIKKYAYFYKLFYLI